MNRLLLLPFILLIAAHTALAQDNGTTMTLNQASELALKNNREAKNAGLEIDKAEDKLGAFRTRRLPSIKLSSLVSQPFTSFDTTFEKGVFGTYEGIGSVPNEGIHRGETRRVIYSIFVLDLKLVQWEPQKDTTDTDSLTQLNEGLAS